MRLTEVFRLVMVNILGNKFKVLLTSLGIVVGAATIILVIAIGQGGQADVADQFKNLNAGAIEITNQVPQGVFGPGSTMVVIPQGAMQGGSRGGGGGNSRAGTSSGGMSVTSFFSAGSIGGGGGTNGVTLAQDDLEDIQLIPNLSVVTISASGEYDITGGNIEEDTKKKIAAVQAEYQYVANLEMLLGDFIDENHNQTNARVCVLGYQIAIELFDNLYYAYDSAITIDGKIYTVIGVLNKMGEVTSGVNPDETIFVPYQTAVKHIMGRQINPQITAIAADVSNVSLAIENINSILKQKYPNATFTVSDAGNKMVAARQSANTLSMLLIAVASIVFIVGGIGIMNVLFVSVKERTREIGILKALGGSKSDILLEFLIESNMISTFGGLLGVGIGYLLIPVVQATGMRLESSVMAAIAALGFAIVTGTVFGIYPAIKAANLKPIEALNYE